ncbi:MAG TPA: hypothetical protein VG963_04430, partial [Polyangiaceae bacterium]|nr:hypothetical protein [Polyangiaceae bacterium]
MKTICCRSFAALALLALTSVFQISQAAAAESCADRTLCQDTSTFSATVTDFRTSVVGSNRQLMAVVNFQNKTDRPLIIGYVEGSGVALDERGNRYKLSGSNALRGIGEIRRNTFDPRFTLQPGERADARFELEFYAKNVVVGVQFQLDMAVREIDPVGGDQYRLGREHVLQFSGLRDGLNAAATSAAGGAVASAAASVSASASAPVPETPVDPCAGRPRCHAAGPFTTEVVQLASGQKQGNNHSVR